MPSPNPNPGGRLRGGHVLFLAALVAAPALAVYRGLGPTAAAWIGGWGTAVSAFAYLIYAWDKRQARDQQWREPERLLQFVALAGGWPGAFLAQRHLGHKSAKAGFQVVFWLIVLLYELVAVDYLLGWPLWHGLMAAVGLKS
jgi:uncharacterized membrane protein YsdA (DUF1294 family)